MEEKITRHFYFREIGFETVGRFLFELETKLNEIMPFYNKMYETTLLEFDPLLNYQVKETYEKKVTGNTQGNANSSSSGSQNEKTNNLFSDTPQGRVDFNTSSHVTTMAQDVGSSTSSNESIITQSQSNNDREEFVRTMEGNSGVQTFSQLVNDYRKTFLNVDMMVIDELNELFMRVY